MPGRAPVDAVGGTQDDGPWPEGISEIVEGETYNRPVEVAPGDVRDLDVTVVEIVETVDDYGNHDGGYAVAIQYDDPTTENGGTL